MGEPLSGQGAGLLAMDAVAAPMGGRERSLSSDPVPMTSRRVCHDARRLEMGALFSEASRPQVGAAWAKVIDS